MDAKNRPGVIRLLIYMLVAAGLGGGFAGWVQSSAAALWTASLEVPTWTPGGPLPVLIPIFLIQLIAISLWITERCSGSLWRFVSAVMTLGLLAGAGVTMYIVFGAHNVTSAFLAMLALWVYALFTTALVGRVSRPAGFLLWPPFIWLSFGVVLSFEVMRLNSGTNFVGGL
tara:strand:- start:672 stop:1184 length:513 start_codon:yes stop_codon:yes gene_type:complete